MCKPPTPLLPSQDPPLSFPSTAYPSPTTLQPRGTHKLARGGRHVSDRCVNSLRPALQQPLYTDSVVRFRSALAVNYSPWSRLLFRAQGDSPSPAIEVPPLSSRSEGMSICSSRNTLNGLHRINAGSPACLEEGTIKRNSPVAREREKK